MSDKYILLIAISKYFMISFAPINEMMNSAGFFKYDKYIQILSSILNIVLSILLTKLFGLSGIILGTIISLIIAFIIRVNIGYTKIIKSYKDSIIYYIKSFIYFIYFLTIAILLLIVNCRFTIDSFYKFLGFGLLYVIISFISLLVFYTTDEFKYLLILIKSFIDKISIKLKICKH